MKSQVLPATKPLQLPKLQHVSVGKNLSVKYAKFVALLAKIYAPFLVIALLALIWQLAISPLPNGAATNPNAPQLKNAQAITLLNAPKPKASTSKASTTGCKDDAERNVTLYFATCPSLYLDFSHAKDGPIDPNVFTIYTGAPEANQEAQYYSNSTDNVAVRNGALTLTALANETSGYRYTSARIHTMGKADFMYGKIVVRAILPGGTGTWPAIWMLPTDKKYSAMSSDSDLQRYLNDGEIDIAESVGILPHTVFGIAHARAFPPNSATGYFSTTTVLANDTTYHDYTVEWTPTTITFIVDSTPYFTFTKQQDADYQSWPFDQRFHLVLNLAIGGTWGGSDKTTFADGVDPSIFPTSMSIKNIAYYPYKPAK